MTTVPVGTRKIRAASMISSGDMYLADGTRVMDLYFGKRVNMRGYRVDGDTIVLVRRTYRPNQHVTVRTDAQVTADLLRTYGRPPGH